MFGEYGSIQKAYRTFVEFFSKPEAEAQAAVLQMQQIWDSATLLGLLQGAVPLTGEGLLRLLQRQQTAGDCEIDQVNIETAGIKLTGKDRQGRGWSEQLQILDLRYQDWDAQLRLRFAAGDAGCGQREALAGQFGQAVFGRLLGPALQEVIWAATEGETTTVVIDPDGFLCSREELTIFGLPIRSLVRIDGAELRGGVLEIKTTAAVPDNIRAVLKHLAPMVGTDDKQV